MWVTKSGSFECLVSGMAGALIGFLWFNFPPARVYLGDSGAYFLGFQIGLFALISSHKGTVLAAMVAPLFVLALPILDTTLGHSPARLARTADLPRRQQASFTIICSKWGCRAEEWSFTFMELRLLFLAMAFAALLVARPFGSRAAGQSTTRPAAVRRQSAFQPELV